MKTNPLLEELWQVKDYLAGEAGYDIDGIFVEVIEVGLDGLELAAHFVRGQR